MSIGPIRRPRVERGCTDDSRARPRADRRADGARAAPPRRAHATARARTYERAAESLAGGVASSYQPRDPWPIYLSHGLGRARLGRRRQRDDRLPQRLRLDGAGPRASGDRRRRCSERVELGHALRRADRGRDRRRRGARSARFGLPRWRFVNSGSEATMDAIRIARGRDRPRHDRQDLRLLPRPPRLRDGLDRRRRTTRSATARTTPRCRTARASRRRVADLTIAGAVQRRRRDGAADRAARSRRAARRPA